MKQAFKIHLGIYASSTVAGLLLALAGHAAAIWVCLPGLLQAFFVFAGHLVTLDDDCPGEWSNAASVREIWSSSIAELSVKFVALVAAGAMTLFAIAKS